MPETTTKPVILLAYANDRSDGGQYLKNLPEEARRVKAALYQAEQANLCDVISLQNCTVAEIVRTFQDSRYRTRIAVFHYAGHAEGSGLLFESATGDVAAAGASGFAEFLGQQEGLALVFLNGCSTQQQTQGLLDAGAAVVISTSRSIDDTVATEFAAQFYEALANGLTIETAFNSAAALIKSAKGDSPRGVYFGSEESQRQLEAEGWPWKIVPRPGSEVSELWNLPRAAGEPLFGLPSLPSDLRPPKRPYRNLEWFRRDDADIFFGRGQQIRELYIRLTAGDVPIVLFYGQSGVGKSSLLDAGLLPRLEQKCQVRYLRRTDKGLLDTLRQVFAKSPDTSPDQPESDGILIHREWLAKEQPPGLPLIIFLDQAEELYTRPLCDPVTGLADPAKELSEFLGALQAIFGAPATSPRGKLVLSFRKEWLAELDKGLTAYDLPMAKVPLERLDRRGIIEAVTGVANSKRLQDRFGLTIEPELAGMIADDLLEDRGSAVATTLQILLSKLWDRAKAANDAHPTFSLDLYHELKKDGILLSDFLDQQIKEFGKTFPEAEQSGLLLDILAIHTTPLGTAGQCTAAELKQLYPHVARLDEILQACQDLSLLTMPIGPEQNAPKVTRLAHDTVAPLVRKLFDNSDKPGQRARRIIENGAVDWKDGHVGVSLGSADLRLVEKGLLATRALSYDENRLMKRSQVNRLVRRMVAVAAVVPISIAAVWGWRTSVALEKEAEQRTNTLPTLIVANLSQVDPDQPMLRALLAKQAFKFYQRTKDPSSLGVIDGALRQLLPGPISFDAHDGYVESLEFSHYGKLLATDDVFLDPARPGTKAKLWDTTAQPSERSPIELPHPAGIWQIAFSPDDKCVATACDDWNARLWLADRPTRILRTLPHGSPVTCLAFISNDQLVTGCRNGEVTIWDLASGDTVKRLIGNHSSERSTGVCSISIIPGSTKVASGGSDGRICFWDASKSNGQPISAPAHSAFVRALASNPSGKLLASARSYLWLEKLGDEPLRYRDNVILLWQAGDLTKAPDVLKGHHGFVNSLTFSNSKGLSLLASGSQDRTVRLWDMNHYQTLPAVLNVGKPIRSVAFSADGHEIAAGCTDGSVTLWKTTESLALSVDEIVDRNLTFNEWRDYIGKDIPYERTSDRRPIDKSVIEKGVLLAAEGRSSSIAGMLSKDIRDDGCKKVAAAIMNEIDELKNGKAVESLRIEELVQRCEPQRLNNLLHGATYLDPAAPKSGALDGKTIATAALLARASKRIASETDATALREAVLRIDPSKHKDVNTRMMDFETRQRSLALSILRDVSERASYLSVKKAKTDYPQLLTDAPYYFRDKYWELMLQAIQSCGQGKLQQGTLLIGQAKAVDPDLPVDARHFVDAFSLSLEIDRVLFASRTGDIDSAISKFTAIAADRPNFISADLWNDLAWLGCVYGKSADVAFAAEKAVAIESNASRKDTRGLVRALNGDFSGAIDDFSEFVKDGAPRPEARSRREDWIKLLKQNENPFTLEVLNDLKNEVLSVLQYKYDANAEPTGH